MSKPVVFFCYPWDLYDIGADVALDQMVEAGATGVSVALAYHMVTAVAPMNPFRTIYYGEDGVVFFKPDKAYYSWTSMVPRPSKEVDDPEYLKYLVEQAYTRRLTFGCWINFAYNNHLASTHPKSAKMDAFGNPHGAQLSPSNRDFRMYCVNMTEDVCDQIKPDELVLQGLSYYPWKYGLAQLKALTPLTPLQEFLLGLDFSPGTMSMAKKFNIDADALQEAVADHLRLSFLKQPKPEEMEEEITDEQIEGLFDGALARYLVCQEAAASLLFENVSKVVRNRKRKLTYTGSTDRVANGLDLFRIKTSLDRLVVHFPSERGQLAQAVERTRAQLLEGTGLMASVCPADFNSVDAFTAYVGSLNDAGVDGYYVYNHALLKPDHLEWLKAAKAYWQ